MEEKKVYFEALNNVPVPAWEKLHEKKIYFAHQSVGNNIVEGMKTVIGENPKIRLNIVATASTDDFNKGIFAHSLIGRNEDPLSKLDAFVEHMDRGIGNKADIALLKLCFVDIHAGTDVNALFSEYKKRMALLKSRYPATTFVHISVPLIKKVKPSFLGHVKMAIKTVLGKKRDSFFDNAHNVARNKFNDLLRNEYEGKEPFFDLAKVESTYPDGTRETFSEDGKNYYALVPEYTQDAGHLYGIGRKKVAEQLLLFLIKL